MVSESVGELRIWASGSCQSPTLFRPCLSGLICTFGVTVIEALSRLASSQPHHR
jgi:hypothetical protein